MAQTVLQQLKKSKVTVFRRFSVRRRLDDASGDYETDWQDLSEFVIKWGTISWALDEKKYNFFTQRGVTITVDNSKGTFDHERSTASFWHNALTRYRTLVKIEAGFVDPDDGSDIPNPSVLFYGILALENIKQNDGFTVALNIKGLHSVLDEVPGNKAVVEADMGSLTSSQLMTKIKNITDGSSNLILQKFISSGAWNISTTTNTLTALNTTTLLDNLSCWGIAKKLAEVENKIVYIDRSAQLNFRDREETTATTFSFVGVPFRDETYGHTIKRIENYQDDIDLLFNRIFVKYGIGAEDHVIAEENWAVGDNTTSWKYGVKKLNVNNDWLSASLAQTIAVNLLGDLNIIGLKVDIVTKLIPHLDLLDKVTVQYEPDSRVIGSKWDGFNWDEGLWGLEGTPFFGFSGNDFKIVKIKHKLDSLESVFTIKEI